MISDKVLVGAAEGAYPGDGDHLKGDSSDGSAGPLGREYEAARVKQVFMARIEKHAVTSPSLHDETLCL